MLRYVFWKFTGVLFRRGVLKTLLPPRISYPFFERGMEWMKKVLGFLCVANYVLCYKCNRPDQGTWEEGSLTVSCCILFWSQFCPIYPLLIVFTTFSKVKLYLINYWSNFSSNLLFIENSEIRGFWSVSIYFS